MERVRIIVTQFTRL